MEYLLPEEIWIEDTVVGTPLARRIREQAGGIECKIVPSSERDTVRDSSMNSGRRVLFLDRLSGPFIQFCSTDHSCDRMCRSQTVTVYGQNASDASTPALPPLTLHANLEDLVQQLQNFSSTGCHLHINTGQYSDSLELEPLTGYAAELVRIFGSLKNVSLELRTRLDYVDSLIGLEPGNTIVNWFVNPPELMQHEDRYAASLESRIAAAARVAEAGYKVAFTYDPMVHYSGWQERYNENLDVIFAALKPETVARFYLGSLRFPPTQKQSIQRRVPHNGSFDSEFIISSDAKMRYFLPIRLEMYRFMVDQIRQRFCDASILLCKEPSEVWERVLGKASMRDIQEQLRQTG